MTIVEAQCGPERKNVEYGWRRCIPVTAAAGAGAGGAAAAGGAAGARGAARAAGGVAAAAPGSAPPSRRARPPRRPPRRPRRPPRRPRPRCPAADPSQLACRTRGLVVELLPLGPNGENHSITPIISFTLSHGHLTKNV